VTNCCRVEARRHLQVVRSAPADESGRGWRRSATGAGWQHDVINRLLAPAPVDGRAKLGDPSRAADLHEATSCRAPHASLPVAAGADDHRTAKGRDEFP
jgi:hypothetical protein